MKWNGQVTCVGMKSSKGEFEGTAYDYTRAFCLEDVDTTKGTMLGQGVVEHNIGDSREMDKFKHLPFPVKCEAEFELVTNGKASKIVVRGFRPVELAKK